MMHIINEKDNRNKTIMVIPESEASKKKEAAKYGIDLDGDLDGDTIKMTDGKIFRFPNMR